MKIVGEKNGEVGQPPHFHEDEDCFDEQEEPKEKKIKDMGHSVGPYLGLDEIRSQIQL